MKIFKLKELTKEEKEKLLKRGEFEVEEVIKKVKPIIEDIKKRKDEAVLEYIEKFDGVKLKKEELLVSEEEKKQAYKLIKPEVLKAIKHAYKNIKKFHLKQKPKDYYIEVEKGVKVGRRIIPLTTAGLYIPGGKAFYPSVMLMLGVPAQVAGVENIIACSPAREDKKIDPATIIAADLCGVSKLFKIGGVQAIAAMAYGTQTIPKVDVIVGPGSPYVSAAQRIVKLDNLRMDFPAGPSEGMVLADDYASPKFVAADVLSEAEHGPDSAGILVTNSLRLAQAVKEEIEKLIEEIPQPRKSFIQENIKKGYSCIIVTRNIEEAIEFVNEYAVEHLVINTKNPMKIMNRIKHAGTFCIGAYSPITVGNFIAGANAILPTGGYAKMFSGVSVDSFVKKPTVEIISKTGLKKLKDDIIALSDFEGFPGHTRSITIRFEK